MWNHLEVHRCPEYGSEEWYSIYAYWKLYPELKDQKQNSLVTVGKTLETSGQKSIKTLLLDSLLRQNRNHHELPCNPTGVPIVQVSGKQHTGAGDKEKITSRSRTVPFLRWNSFIATHKHCRITMTHWVLKTMNKVHVSSTTVWWWTTLPFHALQQ